MRQAWIVVDIVDGVVVRRHAEKRYEQTGEKTFIHQHPFSEAKCNAGCDLWPKDEG